MFSVGNDAAAKQTVTRKIDLVCWAATTVHCDVSRRVATS